LAWKRQILDPADERVAVLRRARDEEAGFSQNRQTGGRCSGSAATLDLAPEVREVDDDRDT
jgi:hypothetical protein